MARSAGQKPSFLLFHPPFFFTSAWWTKAVAGLLVPQAHLGQNF